MKTLCVNICRALLGVVFTLSGFVKAVDPLGTQYKIEDYLKAMGLELNLPSLVTTGVSVGLSGFEFCLGVLMLFAIRRRITSRLMLVMMLLMTPLTLWLAIANPISDCGCFGDAIVLSNWQTFWKNVILLAAAVTVTWSPMSMIRFVSKSNQWIVINYSALFILAIAGWSLYYLPQFDFRPYHVGADIIKGMEIPDGAEMPKYSNTFIYEKDGVRKEFVDQFPDSTWTYVDRLEPVLISKGYETPIHDFNIITDDGEDITYDVLTDSSYTMLLISPWLEKADDSRLDLINELYEYCCDHDYRFVCLTSSSDKEREIWCDKTGAEYNFCQTDATTLKTMIRSNPGLMLLKGGVVMQKWSHNNLPSIGQEQASLPLDKLEIGQQANNSWAGKIARIMLWFVLPLTILTIADRTWAWSKWLRRESNKHQIIKTKTLRPMRKKIVAGNWKMNMNLQDGLALAKELNEILKADRPNCGVVICTPFIHLASIAQFLDQDVIGLGAENCADKEKGAFTGEVSAEMVKSTGAQYVILGHSERREYYKETPEILREKVLLAQKEGLKVIFCIGESLAERESGKQNEVVKAELEGSVFNLSEEDFRKIVIAYEPIWAIGTGKTATAEQAEEIHAYIRSIIAGKYGQAVADDTTILYGGSCKASNAPELFAKPDIDGGLIGGASLKASDFKGIIDAWKK